MLNINYVAGIFDGEGTIGIHRRSLKDASRGYLYYPKIRLAMTGKGMEIVKQLQTQFNGYATLTRKKNDKWKDSLMWTLQSKKDILFFLKKTIPLLFVKKEQATVVRDFFKEGTMYQKDWKSNRMTDSEFERRKMLYDKIILLNKKGK